MATNRRVGLLIEGRVQGVWFRETTRQEAKKLGVTGWVKNLSDGRVEVLAEGPEEKIDKLIDWCSRGPSGARVIRVERFFEEWKGEFASFDIVF